MTPSAIPFFTRHSLPLPRKGDWRAVKRIPGAINGLPQSHGFLAATDGILCYIEQGPNMDRLYKGHVDFFIPDDLRDTATLDEVRKVPVSKKARRIKEEYV